MQRRFWGAGLLLTVLLALWGSRLVINFCSRHMPNALWYVVDERCRKSEAHKPCTLYDAERGFAMLKDIFGKGQYLLIPTRKITGVESSVLLDPKTPNYLALAWAQRHLVREAYKKAGFSEENLPDEILSLTVNSVEGRSQNQLHIHIDCLRKDVLETVKAAMHHTPQQLRTGGEIVLRDHKFGIWRLASLSPSPFLLFADENNSVRANHGVAVLALKSDDGGQSDFLFLEDRATTDRSKEKTAQKPDLGNAEWIQDHSCAVARN